MAFTTNIKTEAKVTKRIHFWAYLYVYAKSKLNQRVLIIYSSKNLYREQWYECWRTNKGTGEVKASTKFPSTYFGSIKVVFHVCLNDIFVQKFMRVFVVYDIDCGYLIQLPHAVPVRHFENLCSEQNNNSNNKNMKNKKKSIPL